MKDTPILLKVKDWLELQMNTTPFINACIGLSLLVLAIGKAAHWILPFLNW